MRHSKDIGNQLGELYGDLPLQFFAHCIWQSDNWSVVSYKTGRSWVLNFVISTPRNSLLSENFFKPRPVVCTSISPVSVHPLATSDFPSSCLAGSTSALDNFCRCSPPPPSDETRYSVSAAQSKNYYSQLIEHAKNKVRTFNYLVHLWKWRKCIPLFWAFNTRWIAFKKYSRSVHFISSSSSPVNIVVGFILTHRNLFLKIFCIKIACIKDVTIGFCSRTSLLAISLLLSSLVDKCFTFFASIPSLAFSKIKWWQNFQLLLISL